MKVRELLESIPRFCEDDEIVFRVDGLETPAMKLLFNECFQAEEKPTVVYMDFVLDTGPEPDE